MARPFKPIGKLVKVYRESMNPDKDKWVNELIDRLVQPISEPKDSI